MTSLTAGELADRFGLELRGDSGYELQGVCSLTNGAPNRLSFLGDKRYKNLLKDTSAGAVILREQDAEAFNGVALISDNPQLSFARAAAVFEPVSSTQTGVHPAAVVEQQARVDESAIVGANAYIAAGAQISGGVTIGAGAVIGEDVHVGAGSSIGPNVTVIGRSQLGERVSILPGTVIGARGFGLVPDENKNWVEIPHLGSVRIGNDVEIGACTTVDRGAIDDTVIKDGCKIDNHIHIAHNCSIGRNTVIAGWTAVAGSTRVGAGCLIAGGVGIADNLEICDGVMVTGMTMVSGNITEPGVYSSGWGAIPRRDWVKILQASRDMPEISERVSQLEAAVANTSDSGEEEGETNV